MKQPHKYYCVLDFEATATGKTKRDIWEIIEFPIVLLNSETLKVESEFHTFVKPIHQKLNDFCIQHTGIQQSWVDKAPSFQDTMKMVHKWICENKLIDEKNEKCEFIIVTCGNWDIGTMIPHQCERENVKVPFYMRKWINIKDYYCSIYKKETTGMKGMLENMGLKLVGRHHSGLDDARNICQIVVKLIQDGAILN